MARIQLVGIRGHHCDVYGIFNGFGIQEMFIQYNYISSLFTYIAHRLFWLGGYQAFPSGRGWFNLKEVLRLTTVSVVNF